MQARVKKLIKINLIVLIICICTIAASCKIVMADSTTIEPTTNQYIELRATKIKDVEGNGKQVIFELWGHDIKFKGFDVRFSYDGNIFSTSNLITNEECDDETQYFAFENEFVDNLDIFSVPYTGNTDAGIRLVLSLNPPVTESEHIKNDENLGTIIDTTGDVLLGKLSFKMSSDEFNISSFKLETSSSSSPKTGIKITIGNEQNYESQSTFRFTDKTTSKNADLANIKLSTGSEEDANYKEYPITPTFDKKILEYNLDLLEYIDKMDLEITKDDEKSSIILKIPKRDENGELIYDSDGTTIIYEEKEIEDLTQEITLNKLGQQDTIIEIKVIAEDKKTTNIYKLTIHRPYGVIKGKIETPYTLSTTGKYISNIYAYKSSEVAKVFDWDEKEKEFGGKAGVDTVNKELHNLQEEKNITTNDDGTFEFTIIPGTYDILVDKPGYLDHIYIYVEIEENKVKDLGTYQLIAGDINKDAIVQIQDIALLNMHNGDSYLKEGFEEKYDLNDDGNVQIKDISIIAADNGSQREIENYKGR